jgi:orotidine-5'-phosphate decarboxylase
MSIGNPILCAIDTPDRGAARRLAEAIGPVVGGLKLGLEFFTANGHAAVREVAGAAPLFLDLKLHDIPNTVAGAVRAVAPLEPLLLTVHCAGGRAMMQAAATAAGAAARDRRRMRLIGVTVLTSLDDADLASVGQVGPALDQVRRLAALAQKSGLDGVVSSPHEVAALRRDCGRDFLLVVPGIRPAPSEQAPSEQAPSEHGTAPRRDDQKRVMTPRAALAAGADYLVIGRPITAAGDPAAACRAILAEILG